ncbi:MAG: hypothetical protein IJ736_10965 [Firmicutes bacterium]|nr:hypothetical protein [Bacillota bacterium]
MWYEEAARNGHEDARSDLVKIYKEEGNIDEADKWYYHGEEDDDGFDIRNMFGDDDEYDEWMSED